jgi:hypothetical protein
LEVTQIEAVQEAVAIVEVKLLDHQNKSELGKEDIRAVRISNYKETVQNLKVKFQLINLSQVNKTL